MTFTSPLYGYTITLPAGWTVRPATVAWDGRAASGHDDPSVDQLLPYHGLAMAFAFAGPVSLDLAHFTKYLIAATARDHSDTCAADPVVTEPIQVAGVEGTFTAWNCGILINMVDTVHSGVGYVFVMRDASVPTATDPADRALFGTLLNSVVLPS